MRNHGWGSVWALFFGWRCWDASLIYKRKKLELADPDRWWVSPFSCFHQFSSCCLVNESWQQLTRISHFSSDWWWTRKSERLFWQHPFAVGEWKNEKWMKRRAEEKRDASYASEAKHCSSCIECNESHTYTLLRMQRCTGRHLFARWRLLQQLV